MIFVLLVCAMPAVLALAVSQIFIIPLMEHD